MARPVRSRASAGSVRRNSSRSRRFARFRATAPPTRFEATMPNRSRSRSVPAPMSVTNRPGTRRPEFWTARNSARARNRTAEGNRYAVSRVPSSQQPAVCAPSRAGASAPGVRSWSACERGIHACDGGGGGSVETCVSWELPVWRPGAEEETRIVAKRQKGCQTRRTVVESPAFRGRPTRPEFSTPVEKPVEIRGFPSLVRVSDCKYAIYRNAPLAY